MSKILGFGYAIIISTLISIYWFFCRTLSIEEIKQCFPYFPDYRPIHGNLSDALPSFILANIKNIISSPIDLIFAIIIFLSFIQTLKFLKSKEINRSSKIQLGLSIIIIIIFLLSTFHEFILSGVAYRTFWIMPFQYLLIYIFIGTALAPLSKVVKILLLTTLIICAFARIERTHQTIRQFKTASQFLNFKNAQIYVSNDAVWMQTVYQTVKFLSIRLKNNETFLTIPHEPLYHYLTETQSPTRQIIFYDYINIKPSQEHKIIKQLIEKNTKYILTSNRIHSKVIGLGTFGKTYCPNIAAFLLSHYKLIKTFGPWDHPSGVTENHAIKIYERLDSNNQ